ncbi:LysM peptidoglycan-binding domain-containing protein [Blautia glucerasea]|uniref:LysM peptidoglycan-binding domain-containing protein n=1 Tax=Blautia glucerasea TaxID=536633 RepID=UPI00156DD4D0|nr:LysM peptidoglycan-binding domain-containing protein [Blautia glucerasea]NSJ25844.1 LysM peptidoglycan-binding domain-containing protein [Blautia glucerasea]
MSIDSNPTKYRMYINFDNDKLVYVVPVLPEKIKVSVKGKTTSVSIDRFGEAVHKGKRDSIVISFSSFFPAVYGRNYCSCRPEEFKEPKKWHKWMQKRVEHSKPCHFVLEGGPLSLNMYAYITSYSETESGGDVGSISYTVELKEYRKPTVKTYRKKKNGKSRTTTSGKRSNNKSKAKTYTVKAKDTLWNIAKKYYKDGKKRSAIYQKNKNVIEAAAKKHGKSSSNNGKILFPGTKLKLP